jgi:GntR family transcriptional regulator, transcriptional repressor for pyruvate dehydrogenase complex
VAASSKFASLGRQSAAATVVESIKLMLSRGELKPGERLPSQRDLSARLGISVPTVREAINSLSDMGLLEARHGSGTYVTALDPEQLMQPVRFALSLSGQGLAELFDARLLLEPAAARLAAIRRTEDELAGMRTCVESTTKKSVTQRQLLEADVELHDRIFRASHNHLLVALMGSIAALGLESRQRTVTLPSVRPQSQRDHERIVDAIAASDAGAAEAAMRDHISNVRDAAVAAGLPANVDLAQS